MTLLREIIKDAYREANLLPIDQALSAPEEAEGFKALIRIIDSSFGNEIGEELRPVSDESVELLQDNKILLLTPTSLTTYKFPKNPKNGSRISIVDSTRDSLTYPVTLDGNGKTIEGSLTSTVNAEGMTKTWFYNKEQGNWSLLSPLTVSSESILPSRFDDYFIIALAMRINPRNGAEIGQQSVMRFREVKRKLQAEYRQSKSEVLEKGLTNLTTIKDYMVPSGEPAFSSSLLDIGSLPLAP